MVHPARCATPHVLGHLKVKICWYYWYTMPGYSALNFVSLPPSAPGHPAPFLLITSAPSPTTAAPSPCRKNAHCQHHLVTHYPWNRGACMETWVAMWMKVGRKGRNCSLFNASLSPLSAAAPSPLASAPLTPFTSFPPPPPCHTPLYSANRRASSLSSALAASPYSCRRLGSPLRQSRS